jgi:YopX protein
MTAHDYQIGDLVMYSEYPLGGIRCRVRGVNADGKRVDLVSENGALSTANTPIEEIRLIESGADELRKQFDTELVDLLNCIDGGGDIRTDIENLRVRLSRNPWYGEEEMNIHFRCWNGEEMVWPDYVDRVGIAHWSENSCPASSGETMLWSGLKDKNGKEIYEGDLLQYQNATGFVRKVEFDRGGFGYYDLSKEWCYLSQYIRPSLDLSVIGNIYANPELVKP